MQQVLGGAGADGQRLHQLTHQLRVGGQALRGRAEVQVRQRRQAQRQQQAHSLLCLVSAGGACLGGS